MVINRERFFDEKEEQYREEILRVNVGLCDKGVSVGLNDEEEALRLEINRVCNEYYFGM